MRLLMMPTELILAVTDLIESVPDIVSLAQTCRYLDNALKLRLYLNDFKIQTKEWHWKGIIGIETVEDDTNTLVALQASFKK